MKFVAEMCRTGLFDFVRYFLHRMTGNAGINAKGLFPVMTGTTRLTLFHISHCETFIDSGGKN